jgi:quinol monooxygenase YgiN
MYRYIDGKFFTFEHYKLRKMEIKNGIPRYLVFIIIVLMSILFGKTYSQDRALVVRVAKLQIDSVQLENYKAALKEQIKAAVTLESGVLTLYAVYEKGNPTHVMVFEIYASQNAYQAHLLTPHFIKYKTQTKEMVKSLDLLETVPIALEAKPKISH